MLRCFTPPHCRWFTPKGCEEVAAAGAAGATAEARPRASKPPVSVGEKRGEEVERAAPE